MLLASPYAERADVDAYVDEYIGDAPVRLVLDPDGVVAERLDVQSYPCFVWLDDKGEPTGPPQCEDGDVL